MNELSWIVCDALADRPEREDETFRSDNSLATAREEAKRFGARKVLVRYYPARTGAPYAANEKFAGLLANDELLSPVWNITSDGSPYADYNPEKTVDAMLSAGASFAWMTPREHDFSLAPWCSGKMYGALSDRRVPLLLEYGDCDPETLNKICSDFPELRVIYLGVPRAGRHRLLYPLMERHRQLYLNVAATYNTHRGVEDLVRNFGAGRLLFGTGFPDGFFGAAITNVTYADISDEAKAAIAYGTIETLMGDIHGAPSRPL